MNKPPAFGIYLVVVAVTAIALTFLVMFPFVQQGPKESKIYPSEQLPIFIGGTTLLIPVVIKLLVGEWATVPTSSMSPAILPGDLIWYKKYSYGAVMPTRISELPFINLLCLIPTVWETDQQRNWGYHRIFGIRKPARMDVIVFRNPKNKNQLLTKRIIPKVIN